ncbi:histidine decarboxylase [Streptomyces sp. NPDC045470]|uniref:histidine decarboxylase n=1 Tax=Streptomyces sp. NPDC045470 TaxID=3155469 RepID=UPI0033C72BFB
MTSPSPLPDLTVQETPRSGEKAREDLTVVLDLAAQMRRSRAHMVGFPVNLEFDYRPLAAYLAVHGNNAGTPYDNSEYHLHSKHFERAVIGFFARLAGVRPEDCFGYLTHGGTESNLFGAWVGRERHPDAVLYASEQAHYSIPKIARLLRMDHEPVAAQPDATLDPDALHCALRRNRERSALVVATIGTTGQGAVDDLPAIRRALDTAGTTGHHLHCDAAFGGLIAALGPLPRPWNFCDGADSIAISGHKMIGSPIPCGIVLARPAHVDAVRAPGAAVGTDDDTISGSRDALSPVLLWRELRRLGRQGLRERIHDCVRTADYATERLRGCGSHPSHLPGTNTVLFDAPEPEVSRQWNLLAVDGRAHLITMPHVTPRHIDRLCADIVEGRPSPSAR